MPPAKRFPDEGTIIAALHECRWNEQFAKSRRGASDHDLSSIIHDSVGKNTFRAFRHQPRKPSETFRSWALSALDNARLNSLRQVNSQPQYSGWLMELSDHFRSFWKDQMEGNEISYGPSLKLPNLLMRHVCLYKELSDVCSEKLRWYLEVPLDSYTIQAVANCVDSFAGKAAIGKIPLTATMNFVRNRAMYEAFQDGIRQIAKKAGVPAIALDLAAWDDSHQAPHRTRPTAKI